MEFAKMEEQNRAAVNLSEMMPRLAEPKMTSSKKKPRYKDMISEAIVHMKERRGSSRQAIVKYISSNYELGRGSSTRINSTLNAMVKEKTLIQTKGVGANGSFKVNKNAVPSVSAKAKKKKKAKKKPKKKKPKKKAKKKKPKKKAKKKPKKKAKKKKKPKKKAKKKKPKKKPKKKAKKKSPTKKKKAA